VGLLKLKMGHIEIAAEYQNIENKEKINTFFNHLSQLYTSLDDSIDLEKFFKNNKNTILAKKLNSLCDMFGAGNEKFHLEYGSLLMLADDLSLIKKTAPDAFAKFRRELFKQRSSVSWHGFRFEVRLFSSFIKKGISITNQESPDFSLTFNESIVFIEAAISRVEQPKNRTHLYKIQSVINKKNKKKYANFNTALFIDITSILYHDSLVLEENGLESIISSIYADKKIKFGAVILFVFTTNSLRNRYESTYKRIVFEHCSPSLKIMMDDEYPKGNGGRREHNELSMSC
jgi:hypothetical protein